MTTERELPEGVSRKQIVALRRVREYIKQRSKEEGKTVSQFLADDVFPEDWETTYHGYEDDEIVHMKVTPEVDEMVDRMTGGRVDKGEVVAFYALLDAHREGDSETVEELVEGVPTVIWDLLGGPE